MNEKETNNLNNIPNKSSLNNINNINNKIEISLLEEYLKCPICNTLYDSDSHLPFVIKCGHSFCKQCISNNSNKKCPFDNLMNAFELYIQNIQLEIIINKLIHNFNNKNIQSQKQIVYIKPDIKKNINIYNEENEENINGINNENPNRKQSNSESEKKVNNDYNINYEQNSPIYNKQSNIMKNKINSNDKNDENIIIKNDENTLNFHHSKNNSEEKNNIKISDKNIDNINEFNIEEDFKFEDEKICGMKMNESIETIPIFEETIFSIKEDFNELLTKNEIYKKRIIINSNTNINNNEQNKNNIKANYNNNKSPCKKIIIKDNINNNSNSKNNSNNNNNINNNFFNEINKRMLIEDMGLTISKQHKGSSNFNIGVNSEKEICTNEIRQLTESNNNTEKKIKENRTFQNFFNSANTNKNNSNSNTNSNNNNTTNNKNIKNIFDNIQSASSKPSISNNLNILEKKNENKNNNMDLIVGNTLIKNRVKNNKDINNDLLKNKIIKNHNSIGEKRSDRKYIKVRASSKISKKKQNIIQNNNNSDNDEEIISKKNYPKNKNKTINQIKVIPKRENTYYVNITKNNNINKCINLSTLYSKKKIISHHNNGSINNSGMSLEKYINGRNSFSKKQKYIEIKRKETFSQTNHGNKLFNHNINSLISPEKNKKMNIIVNTNEEKNNTLNDEIENKTINLNKPGNLYNDNKTDIKENNFKDINENNKNSDNKINSFNNLNCEKSNNSNNNINNNLIEQKNLDVKDIQKNKEINKSRSQSTNNKSIINNKIYVSQNMTLKNNNNNNQDLNIFSSSKNILLTKNEMINKLKKEYESLSFKDKLLENKIIYDDFFEISIENSIISEIITNKDFNPNLFSIKFIENDSIFLGLFEKDLITPKKGILLTVNGEYYEGEFMNGKKDGKGKLLYKNGTEYIGYFKNNKHNGYGQLTQIDGEIFQGEWKDGKINGNGTRFHSNGDKYIGNYVNNIRNGYGYYIFSNGDSYEGNWKDGKANGQGVFKFNNGNIYEGEFKDNLISGKGKFTLKNGDIYTGNFVNGLINGKGTMENNKGEKYVGFFLNGKKNGMGKLMNKNGKIIQQGSWRTDIFLGKGE